MGLPEDAGRFAWLLPALLAGCVSDINPGFDPPDDQMQFPGGLTLDPRVSDEVTAECVEPQDCGAGESCAAGVCRARTRWLFVTDANSDLRFNGSALLAVDLERFHRYRRGPTVTDGDVPEILAPGERVSEDQPCRRLTNKPQVVECTEEPFIDETATVHMGHFASIIAAWDRDPGDDEAALFVPIRGDPSIAWFSIRGGLDGEGLDIDCGQGSGSGQRDPRRCANEHRLTHLRDDQDLSRLGAEPINIHVNPTRELAYVTHAADADLSLIALRGLEGDEDKPVLVDRKRYMIAGNPNILSGSFGVAERPCDPAQAPNATLGCERPLVYAGLRYQREIVSTTVFEIGEDDLSPGQTCVGPDDLGGAGALICDPQFDFEGRFFAGGISPAEFAGPPQLGDMAFSADGKELFVVQTNPGALLRIDTSLDTFGNPRDLPAGVVEVCPRATALAIYRDGQDDYALVSCYRSAAVFVIDLNSLVVVGNIQAGTGPHEMAVDLARELVYIANTLEATVSVVEMSRESESRFGEIARIGLQEPFSND